MLPQELLKELFDYCDGELYWKVKRKGTRGIGEPAGGKAGTRGYKQVSIDYVRYGLHRLIYAWHHGRSPEEVDHIDGNPNNNKIENLRAATMSQNKHNRRMSSHNTSGVKGVYWHKTKNRWRVKLLLNSKEYHIGYFKTLEEAAEAVKTARIELHGEFANHG